jgi:hypothetical protein
LGGKQSFNVLARHFFYTVEKMPQRIRNNLTGRFAALSSLSPTGLNYAQNDALAPAKGQRNRLGVLG